MALNSPLDPEGGIPLPLTVVSDAPSHCSEHPRSDSGRIAANTHKHVTLRTGAAEVSGQIQAQSEATSEQEEQDRQDAVWTSDEEVAQEHVPNRSSHAEQKGPKRRPESGPEPETSVTGSLVGIVVAVQARRLSLGL
jgi:hypothetical protein